MLDKSLMVETEVGDATKIDDIPEGKIVVHNQQGVYLMDAAQWPKLLERDEGNRDKNKMAQTEDGQLEDIDNQNRGEVTDKESGD